MDQPKTQFSETSLPGFDLHRLAVTRSREAGEHGHRQRMRDRFLQAGSEATSEQDLLEMILFRAIPRREVRSLAMRLLEVFDDLNRVIGASRNRLAAVQGVGSQVIHELKIVEAAGHTMARAKVMQREVISNWEALLCYCQTKMAHMEREQFRVLFLDRRNCLIADVALQNGTVDHVPVYPREVARKALEVNASAVILVHNHPSGDAAPSPEDVSMTKKVQAGVEAVGVTLHDHVIVGRGNNYSLRAHDLI